MTSANLRKYAILGIAASFLIILHILYSAQSQQHLFQGIYFASGSIITSSGATYDANLRSQSHGRQLHLFEQINLESQKYSLRLVSSLFGNGRFITERDGAWLKSTTPIDRDISFNHTYLSAASSELTLYKLKIASGSPCFYIKELSAVRCFGPER